MRYLKVFIFSTVLLLQSVSVVAQKNIGQLENKLDQAQKNDDPKKEAEYYIKIGDYHVAEGKINKGQRHYNRSLRTNDNQFPELTALTHRQYARSYIKENKYEDARTSYQQAKKVASKAQLKDFLSDLNNEISQFEEQYKDIQQAESQYEKYKSLKKDEAIALIEQENESESDETDEFLNEISLLSKANQLKELKLRFKQNEIDKKELKIEMLNQHNQLKSLENERNKAALAQKDAEIAQKEAETKQQRTIIGFTIGGLILLIILVFVIIKANKKQQKLNVLLKNKNQIIYEKNKETTDSIRYAKKIQDALLLSSKKNQTILPESFVFFEPKDIVSGDFYWINKSDDGKIIWTVADCTGHGVPGAFMSMIGTRLLNEIILEKGIVRAGKILDELKAGIIRSLNQEGKHGEAKDGMDMGICVWDPKDNTIEYAGANNSIYLIRKDINLTDNHLEKDKTRTFENDLLEIKPNRIPIGYNPYINTPFDTVKFKVQKGDLIFAFSDGYQDQFGGPESTKGKKFTTKRLKRLLTSIQDEQLEKQKSILAHEFEQWKGSMEQIDDVCVIGVRL